MTTLAIGEGEVEPNGVKTLMTVIPISGERTCSWRIAAGTAHHAYQLVRDPIPFTWGHAYANSVAPPGVTGACPPPPPGGGAGYDGLTADDWEVWCSWTDHFRDGEWVGRTVHQCWVQGR